MGRTLQKSRKHKKLKFVDPFNFKAKEENRQKSGVNRPPKSCEQEIPRAFREIFMKPKERTENNESTIIESKKNTKPQKDAGFVKRDYETERQFLKRINRETSDFVNEELHKIKYDLNNEVPELKQKKNNDSLGLTKKEKKVLSERKKSKSNKDSTASTSSISTDGLKKIKKKRKKQDLDLLNLKEYIPFGERVDAPPNLMLASKKLKTQTSVLKTGGKKDLLLKTLIPEQQADALKPLPDKSLYVNDGTIKCDDEQKRLMLIEERNRVIEQYRWSKRFKSS